MEAVRIVLHIFILVIIYLVGVWIQQTFSLVIPGSIIGMILLFLLLTFKIIKPQWIEKGTSLLLAHMTILFMPAMVGIINYLDLFTSRGIILIIIAAFSTLLVLLISGKLSEQLAMKGERENG